jgi:GntR family transcriptional regulator
LNPSSRSSIASAKARLRCAVAAGERRSPDTLISSLIESRYGRRIAEIRQDVQAILIPEELADKLQAGAGSPGLKIIRRYFNPVGEMFEASVTVHPADRFVFSTRLQRSENVGMK